MVIGVWTAACTIVWATSLEARQPGSLQRLLRSPTTYWGGAALLALVAASVVLVEAMVARRQTIFGIGETSWPPKLVELVRSGRPPLEAPIVVSGRWFTGPYLSKSRRQGKLDGLELELPGWEVRGRTVPLTPRFARKRFLRVMTCPELTGGVLRCRTIKPPWNEPLVKVTVPRHVYFSDKGFYEFSDAIPNVSLWQQSDKSPCWLHLEDWPAKGDAVRTEADCHSPWPEQAARLRALLETRFPQVA